jgi:hypothetical protein
LAIVEADCERLVGALESVPFAGSKAFSTNPWMCTGIKSSAAVLVGTTGSSLDSASEQADAKVIVWTLVEAKKKKINRTMNKKLLNQREQGPTLGTNFNVSRIPGEI